MKKMLKILLWTIVGVLALGLALVATIPLWLGPTVTTVANKVAPEYTGTPFSLDGVGINPYTGKYRITKLNLGNPKDYPVPTAFSVSNVLVDVEMSSLFTDTIHIREIMIEAPYVSYVSKDGTNNFEWIGAHAAAKAGPKEEEEEKAEEEKGPGKKVVIDKLTIAGTRVKLKILPEMPIPTITLTDIGKEKGGATWAEVGNQLVEAVMNASNAVGKGLTSAIGVLGDGAGTVLSGTTNVLSGAAGLLGDGASKAVSGIGGLLGGEKKDAAEKKSDGEKKDGSAPKEGSGVIDAGKAAGKGVIDAGKAVGNGAIEAGKAIGNGAKDAVKKVGELLGK